MRYIVPAIVWLILAQFIDGRVALVLVATALAGWEVLRHHRAEGQRALEDVERMKASDLAVLRSEEALARNEAELAQARQELEEAIHLAGPGSTLDDFVPSFVTWGGRLKNQDLTAGDALESYVEAFALYDRKYPDEPARVTLARSILNVIAEQKLKGEGDADDLLFQYETGLWMRVRNHDLRRELGRSHVD